MPEVSIIIPVYNVEKYLEKCVRSVYAQTFGDFEVLLIDDGSTDSSAAMCDRLCGEDPRARVIHQKNAGLGGARNTGIDNAEGQWLLFVDSDDYLEKDILEKALLAAKRHSAHIVMFAYRSVTEEGECIEEIHEALPKDTVMEPEHDTRVYLASPCAWNKLYKKELFDRSGGIRYPGRVWYEDIRTTLKLYPFSERVVFIDEIGYNYVQRAGSIVNNRNADKNEDIIDAFEDLIGWFTERGEYDKYRRLLCRLAVYHVFVTASVRVLRIDRKHPLLEKFYVYLNERFPGWEKEPLVKEMGKKHRLLIFLLRRKLYFAVWLLFRLKG